MAKTVLKFDSDDAFDFLLVGIICHQKDYRLCHELNRKLSLELARQDDYELRTPKRMNPAKFAQFKYKNEDDDVYYIFSNKGKDDLLIPEQHQVDYFMMIQENFKRIEMPDLINDIRNINFVLGAYPIDVKILKSKEHFLF
jgi:hypothetical protein